MTRPVWELMDQLTIFSACPAAPLETANSLCPQDRQHTKQCGAGMTRIIVIGSGGH